MNRIHLSAKRIIEGHDLDALHTLRMDFKKLRAFTRVIRLEAGRDKSIRIHQDLKKIYKLAGSIRDREIHTERLLSHYSQAEMPKIYLRNLAEENNKLLDCLTSQVRSFPFEQIQKKIAARLPDRLRKKTIEKYFKTKTKGFDRLLENTKSDANLHGIRKYLKDILFNAGLFKDETIGKDMLRQFRKKKKIDQEVGEYNDARMGLVLMRKKIHSSRTDEDKLGSLLKELTNEKNRLRRKLMKKLAG